MWMNFINTSLKYFYYARISEGDDMEVFSPLFWLLLAVAMSCGGEEEKPKTHFMNISLSLSYPIRNPAKPVM